MRGGLQVLTRHWAWLAGGLGLVAVSALVYWFADRGFDAGRGDFFYLADAFLNGRTWLTFQPGPWDVIIRNGHFYVPFAPFPAIVAMPLIAIIGPVAADHAEPIINPAPASSLPSNSQKLVTPVEGIALEITVRVVIAVPEAAAHLCPHFQALANR